MDSLTLSKSLRNWRAHPRLASTMPTKCATAKPRLFTRPHWRYLLERTQSKLQKKAARKRLDAHIQDLPTELQLDLLEHWTQANPILVNHSGQPQHPLLDKNVILNAKENAAVHRAAPIVLNFNAYNTQKEFRDLGAPAAIEDWMSKWDFLDTHDKIYGKASRKRIRLDIKVTVRCDCPRKLRIFCDELGKIVQEPTFAHNCEEPRCKTGEIRDYVTAYIQSFTDRFSEHVGVPRENVTAEFKFVHKCRTFIECEETHRKCVFRWSFVGPLCLIASLPCLWILASVILVCDPRGQYEHWVGEYRMGELGVFDYLFFLGPGALGAVVLMPLVLSMRWTVSGLIKAIQAVLDAKAERRKLRRWKLEISKFKAEESAPIDVLSAFQLGGLDFEPQWSESILLHISEESSQN